MSLTRQGDILIVPTPGHTPHHISVVVGGSPTLFLAGDTSYNQQLLIEGKVDGVSPSDRSPFFAHPIMLGRHLLRLICC